MYVSRVVLLVLFGVLVLPPMIAQLAMRIPHGWLLPACLWGLVIIGCFWMLRSEQRTHG